MAERLPAPRGILSGFALKWIAVASMVIDHFGSIVMDGVLAPYRADGSILFTPDMPFFVYYAPAIKQWCEALGSVAFPIFCFLIVEGFLHTRDRMRYGLRLLLFALISEIPFDLAHKGVAFSFSLQNVLFTLCVGVFTLLAAQWAEARFAGQTGKRIALTALAVIAGAGLAFLIRSEYVFLGVASIALFYLLRGNRYWRLIGVAPLLVASPWALLALIPIFLYSGERGKGSQYFFYIFYPAHFLAFAGVAWLLAGRAV